VSLGAHTQSDRRLRSILIVGGGSAGWAAAARIAKAVQPLGIRVGLVESEEIGIVGVGEATVPHMKTFNAKLGLDEADFMRQTKGTFKLGIDFRGWNEPGDSYIHPFAPFGRPIASVPLHHSWVRISQEEDVGPLEDYSVPILAARENRFALPSNDPASLLSTFTYAYQFDAGLYAQYLRKFAEGLGVVRTEGKIARVDLRPEDGFVEAVTLEDGRRLDADFFVDCSGFRSLIIGQALKVGYEEWSHWLRCDRAIAAPCADAEPITPYTRVTAQEAGWRWRIPLQHRVGNGYVYCSEFISDDEAEATLLARLETPASGEPRRLRFTPGRRRKQWVKNCVSIGLASGFLEPLESTSIYLAQFGVDLVVDLLPDRDCDPVDAEEFNRIMDRQLEYVRDFLILHYYATRRAGTPFWDYCRTMSVPDSLLHRIALFRERGSVRPLTSGGIFQRPSWQAVFFGQGVVPAGADPRAERIPAEAARTRLGDLRAGIRAAVETLPSHRDFILRYCSSGDLESAA
jgi:tryptophan halogenase